MFGMKYQLYSEETKIMSNNKRGDIMKGEPLRYKLKLINNAAFSKEDVKSAVDWLKKEINKKSEWIVKREDGYEFKMIDETKLCLFIDKAFADVV